MQSLLTPKLHQEQVQEAHTPQKKSAGPKPTSAGSMPEDRTPELQTVTKKIPRVSVGYHKGFFIKSATGKFSLKINVRVQALGALILGQSTKGLARNNEVEYAFLVCPGLFRTDRAQTKTWRRSRRVCVKEYGAKTGEPGAQSRLGYFSPNPKETDAAFSIPRARFALSGHAFNKAVRYKFQADFGKGFGKGFGNLKDFYIDYTIVPKTLRLRVGEFKRPFSRQQINSSGRLALVDRAITDKFFGAGHDVGMTLHNGYSKSPTFEYALGVLNGTGDKAKFSANGNRTAAWFGVKAREAVWCGPKCNFLFDLEPSF